MNSRERPATIVDVAKRAGVSVGSVSNVFNGTRIVSDELRKQVLAAAHGLGYQVNSVAQTLRSKRSNIIGLCTTFVTTVYLRELADALDDITSEHGYELYQVLTKQEPQRELQRVRSLVSRQVDGIIILPSLAPQAALDAIIQSQTPAVVVDRLCEDSRFNYVIVDNRQAMRRVVAILRNRGHERLLFVAQNLDVITTRHRISGLEEEARSAEAILRYEAIERGENEKAYVARLQRILSEPDAPTAIITGNSSVALSTVKALKELGLAWPSDISLVTFDNPEWAGVLGTPLSTVRAPTREIAQAVWSLLQRQIEGTQPQTQTVAVEADVIERAL